VIHQQHNDVKQIYEIHYEFYASGLAAYEHDDFKQVEMASGEKQAVGPSVDNCIVDLGVCTTRLKVYVTALGAYDLIIGMDWLAAHRALVDCFAKRVLCVDDEGRPEEIQVYREKCRYALYPL
jgi:hypothetical protein